MKNPSQEISITLLPRGQNVWFRSTPTLSMQPNWTQLKQKIQKTQQNIDYFLFPKLSRRPERRNNRRRERDRRSPYLLVFPARWIQEGLGFKSEKKTKGHLNRNVGREVLGLQGRAFIGSIIDFWDKLTDVLNILF